jgi:tetratricopeptide (TPR) repeat protein
MGRRILLHALTLLALLAASARAQQPAPESDPLAVGRREFDAGVKEFNLGHYESALQHWETSYRLTSKPALLYNLGFVNKRLFEQTLRLDYLQQSIERLRAFLDTTKAATDPRTVSERAKGEQELKDAEAALAREKAARAKGEETLSVGEEFLKAGRVDEAKAQVESYEHTPGNERAGVVRALLLRAGIAAAQGRANDSVDAYESALELDRSLEIDKSVIAPAATWPQAAKAFSTAQSKIGSTPVLSVNHAAPASTRLGKPVTLTFTGSPDPMGLARGIRLHYRAGAGAYSSLPQVAPLGPVALPREFLLALLPGGRIEYYAELVDRNGAVLEHLGTALVPFVVPVEKPTKDLAKKWWFWSALGGGAAVVTGGAVLTWYLLNPPPQEIPFVAASGLTAFGR